MKKIILVVSLLISANIIFAQSPLAKGGMQINAGLGFSSWGVPLYVGGDYGIHEDITVGGELSFRTYSNNFGGYKFTHTIFGIVGRGNYHFNRILNIPSPWDFYAGLNLGYYIWSTSGSLSYTGSGSTGIGLNAQVGGRYYFNNKFGINLEFGGGYSSGGKIGISYKL